MSRRIGGKVRHHAVRSQWRYGPHPANDLLRDTDTDTAERKDVRYTVPKPKVTDLDRSNPFDPITTNNITLTVHMASNYAKRLEERFENGIQGL